MSSDDSGSDLKELLGIPDDAPVSRRQMVRMMGAAGLAGLAGCGGDGGGTTPEVETVVKTRTVEGDEEPETIVKTVKVTEEDEETASPTSAGGMVDTEWAYPTGRDTQNVDWNPFNPTFGPIFAGEMYRIPLGVFDNANQEWKGLLASDWTVEQSGMTLTFDDRFVWQDGDPITADDFITQSKLSWHHSGSKSGMESLEKLGDRKVRINFSADSVNPNVVLPNYLNTKMMIKDDIFGQYLKPLEEAQGDMSLKKARKTDAHKEALSELQNFVWRAGDDSTPEIVLSGPYQPVDQGQQRIVFELNEEYPFAATNEGELNFPRCVAVRTPDDRKVSAWAGDEFDGRETGAPPDRQLPSKVTDKLVRNSVQLNMGRGLWIRHTDKWLTRRRVRHALAYIIDRQQVTANTIANQTGAQHIAVDYPTFITGYSAGDPNEIYLGEDYQDTYRKFGVDPKKATSILEAEGFSKQNNEWITPDGETWQPRIGTGTGGSPILETVNSQLEVFGVQSQLNAYDPTSLGQAQEDGEFEIGLRWWGWGPPTPYPYFTIYPIWGPWETSGHGSYTSPETPTDAEMTVEVPMPIGDWDGDLQEFSPKALTDELQSTADQERANELIRLLVWISNVDLPMLPMYERLLEEALVGAPEWQLADDDDPVWDYGTFATRQHFYWGKISAMR